MHSACVHKHPPLPKESAPHRIRVSATPNHSPVNQLYPDCAYISSQITLNSFQTPTQTHHRTISSRGGCSLITTLSNLLRHTLTRYPTSISTHLFHLPGHEQFHAYRFTIQSNVFFSFRRIPFKGKITDTRVELIGTSRCDIKITLLYL